MNSVVNLNAPPIAVFTCFHITALTSPLLGYGTGPNLDDDELPPSYGYVDMGGPVALMSGTAGPALATSFTTASTYGPLPLTVEFDASASTSSTGTIVEYRYEFGDGAGISTNLPIITHTYDTVGVRTVTLEIVNSEGLTAQTQRLVNVSDAPISPTSVLSASPRAGAIPLVVEFNATMSFSPLEEIVEYRFQFGDGTEEVSTSPVASHTYTSLGIYFASVTTVTMSGRTSTSALVPISLFGLNQLPVASFSCTKTGNSVTCDASGSYDLDGEIVDFVWEVSALNLTATGSLLTFEVAEDQTVFVRLSVTDNSGATSMKEKQIGGNLPPLAILNCRIELPNRASCDPALSYDPDGVIVSYKYTIKSIDGTVLGSYTLPGPYLVSTFVALDTWYQVTLTVTDNQGGVSTSAPEKIFIPSNQPPVANLSCFSPSPLTISCDPFLSYDPDGLIAGYELKVGADGEFLPYANFNNISVSMAGDYEITLRVTDNLGVQALSTPITVHVAENLAPIAMISCSVPDEVNSPFYVECDTSASIDNDGTIIQRVIDWGDGNVENIWSTAYHSYTSGGSKLIQLTVRDNLNAEAVASTMVNLNAPPVAAFTCFHINSLTIKCDASASTDDGGIVSYAWNLNGVEKTGTVITQSFTQEQWINIALTVTDNLGLQNTTQQSFFVESNPDIPLPVAAFEHTILDNNQVLLDASDSVFGGRVVTQFIWTFGDGTTQTLTVPTLTYSYVTPGWYTVTLKTIDQNEVESPPQSMVIRVHTPNVVDPGIAGEATLEGIDSNSDGVRDDVERFIDEYFGENNNKRQAMRQVAVTLDLIVKSNADTTVAQPLFIQLDRDTRCVISQFVDETDDWSSAIGMLNQKTFNTKERLDVYLNLDKNADIGTFAAEPQAFEEYANNCLFTPTP